MSEHLIFNLFVVAFLLFVNGFFVASEFAFVSVRSTKMKQFCNEGNTTAEIVCKEIDHLDEYIAAVQLGITIASIGLGWVGESVLASILTHIFDLFEPAVNMTVTIHSVATVTAFSLITFMHVVIGELMPKSIALRYPERTALIVARPMRYMAKIFKPFIFLLNGFGNFLLGLMHIPAAKNNHNVHTTEELNMIIDASYNEGILNETEKDMLQNIFKFSDLSAKQVMIPRPDIVAIPSDISLDELKETVLNTQYTRYPVYSEDLDHITGLMHVKDLYAFNGSKENFKIENILREVKFFPETVNLDKLVVEFQKCKIQLAVVVDEFGGTSGIVTLEDILEEIIGEVQDEFDTDEVADIEKISEDTYIANGMMRIDEFAEYFEIPNIPEEEDIETIAGIVVKRLERIAEVGDVVPFGDFEFTVTEVDGARILKIKIVKKPQPVESSEEEN